MPSLPTYILINALVDSDTSSSFVTTLSYFYYLAIRRTLEVYKVRLIGRNNNKVRLSERDGRLEIRYDRRRLVDA